MSNSEKDVEIIMAKTIRRTKEKKTKKVLKEFKRGTLRTSGGKKVTSRKQAVAIALRKGNNNGNSTNTD